MSKQSDNKGAFGKGPGERKPRPGENPEETPATAQPEGKDNAETPAPPPAAGDDRNLVLVDKDFTDADLDDRLWLFWQRYRTHVYAAVITIFAVWGGYSAWELYQQHRTEKLQAGYQAALGDNAKLVAFAKDNAGTELAGLALLKAADANYGEAKFGEAADLYGKAAESLKGTPIAGRALIGKGMSLLKAGQAASAKPVFEGAANDAALVDTYRAEAAFHLATHYHEAKDLVNARAWYARSAGFAGGGIWKGRAEQILANTPELAAAK